jgi:hypothetical protein
MLPQDTGDIAKSTRQRQAASLKAAWSSAPLYGNLPKEHGDRLVKIMEFSLYHAARNQYLRNHSVVNWTDAKFIDTYSSLGAKILYNVDQGSSLNVEWRRQAPEAISVADLCLRGYCYRARTVHHLEPETARAVWGCVRRHLPGHGKTWLDPEGLAEMSSVEINIALNHTYLMDREERERQKLVERYSEMYKCSVCGNRKTKYRIDQTRSLDEASTVTVTCMSCGNIWKQ